MATIEFHLLNLSKPSYTEGTKKIEVDVKVVGDTENDNTDMSEFVKIDGTTASYEENAAVLPIVKYNYCDDNSCCIEKYNFPPIMKYNYCDDNSCCIEKYNFPPIMKYNYLRN